MTAIERRIDAARRAHRVADALAARDEARDALLESHGRALDNAARQFLLGEIEREHETENLPATMEEARRLFSGFTRALYALRVRDDRSRRPGAAEAPVVFRALERASRRERALDHLSRGTRMHLLLAVPLSFATHAEQGGARLPIFIAEVLRSSAPAR